MWEGQVKRKPRDGKLPYIEGGGGGGRRGVSKKNSEWMSVFPVPPPPWVDAVEMVESLGLYCKQNLSETQIL
jgi:hypothetical protein